VPTIAPMAALQWDIFCRVIDNHGDLGVCWRLAAQLSARGQRVRLWVDDASALAWMAPAGAAGVSVLPWTAQPGPVAGSDVLVEAFGCDIAPETIASCLGAISAGGQIGTITWPRMPLRINLEYLSAEPYVERSHALPSPIREGPMAGQVRWYFYPGFTARTGGLLREPDLLARQAAFDGIAWRAARGVPADAFAATLFCYEPPGLAAWLQRQDGVHVLPWPGRPAAALAAVPHRHTSTPLSYTDQPGFDAALWASDLNFVRGEDSWVRAIWAGKPFVWQPYPQDDGAHAAKLEAFLDWMDAPKSLRQFHRAWAGTAAAAPSAINLSDLRLWGEATLAARARLLAQDDLATRLLAFAAQRRAGGASS
jgi:uncharacterized repeat protein (TIGR03837 family)